MDPMGGSQQSHHDRHVLTDLTVALLQDTGWCALPHSACLWLCFPTVVLHISCPRYWY